MNRLILIVDDDVDIGYMVETALRQEGYRVLRAYSGTEAMLLLEWQTPDLILLDLMLPGLSGEEILPRIATIPVIVMSAKTDISHKVQLLLDGAADYVTKPFALKELLARIEVQLRKTGHVSNHRRIKASGLILDTDLMTVFYGDRQTALTRTECAILEVLMLEAGRPIGKSSILDRIADSSPDGTERSLKQHVSNIRKKLQLMTGVDYIEGVYGIGFRFLTME